jgi:endonuclease G
LQSYEVIGNPPNIAVPTHFAKVIMTSKSPATAAFGFGGPGKSVSDAVKDVAIGAFVLPNSVIPDQVPLTSFQVPGKSIFIPTDFHFTC